MELHRIACQSWHGGHSKKRTISQFCTYALVCARQCACVRERDRGRVCVWTWKSDGVSDPGSVIYFTQSKSVSYFALTKCLTSRVAGKRLTVAAAWRRKRTIKFLAQIHLELHTFAAASARYALLLKINRAPQTHCPPCSLAPSNKTPTLMPLQQCPSQPLCEVHAGKVGPHAGQGFPSADTVLRCAQKQQRDNDILYRRL